VTDLTTAYEMIAEVEAAERLTKRAAKPPAKSNSDNVTNGSPLFQQPALPERDPKVRDEAIAALVALEVKKDVAAKWVDAVPGSTTEEVIKNALRQREQARQTPEPVDTSPAPADPSAVTDTPTKEEEEDEYEKRLRLRDEYHSEFLLLLARMRRDLTHDDLKIELRLMNKATVVQRWNDFSAKLTDDGRWPVEPPAKGHQ
jgi:hypothetical protein